MGKTVSYTVISPLDHKIPRQLALDLLHSHEEIIRLNPLVTDVGKIETPQNAATDEFFAQWYEITEKITFIPGVSKMIKFKGCWYDQAWGVQTHSLMGSLFDLWCTYRIGGNQPGEPREEKELGVNKPLDGLYLREDIRIELHIPIPASFVKKEMQKSSATMIARMKRKAELLDDGRLLAMFENGMLKTTRAGTMNMYDSQGAPGSPMPGSSAAPQPSPRSDTFSAAPGRYSDLHNARSVHRNSGQPGYQYENADSIGRGPTGPVAEMSAEEKPKFVAELSGSMPSYSPSEGARSRPASFQNPSPQLGSRPASTGSGPPHGKTVINHVPPASQPNGNATLHPPALQPGPPARS